MLICCILLVAMQLNAMVALSYAMPQVVISSLMVSASLILGLHFNRICQQCEINMIKCHLCFVTRAR